ncbi:MAG: hypothetical protein KDA60_10515, partial [Planctomycetales bacterium]|nr:hypothetical protein [Planctomycetales bacterium]
MRKRRQLTSRLSFILRLILVFSLILPPNVYATSPPTPDTDDTPPPCGGAGGDASTPGNMGPYGGGGPTRTANRGTGSAGSSSRGGGRWGDGVFNDDDMDHVTAPLPNVLHRNAPSLPGRSPKRLDPRDVEGLGLGLDPGGLFGPLPLPPENETCEQCDNGDQNASSSGPATTYAPVHLGRGAVLESAVDLSLPTPIGNWQAARNYSSQSTVQSIMGNGWMVGLPDMYLEDTSSTELTLYVDSASKRVFGVSGSPAVYTAPADSYLELEHDDTNDIFILSDSMSQKVWVFNDFDVTDPDHRGKLIEQTNRQWWENQQASSGTTHFGNQYNYDADGQIETVDLAVRSGTPAVATYTYDNGRIKAITVASGGSTILVVVYTYYGETGVPANSDLGTSGDLVQVQVLRHVTDSAATGDDEYIVRTTQYRYDGTSSRVKAVYESDAIQRIIDEDPADGIAGVDDILALDDDGDTGELNGNALTDYASRQFIYYTSDLTTNGNLVTEFGTEQLQTKYGGVETSEATDNLVEKEIIGGAGCCGGSGTGVTKQYYYMDLNTSESYDPNVVTRIVVEDTIDANGDGAYRTIYGLNHHGRMLRKAMIEDPTGTPRFWCRSWIITAAGKITEFRMPSAHNVATYSIDEYLNPYSSSSWTNDTNTLKSSSGLIYVNAFTANGNRYASFVKQGRSGTSHLLRYNTFLGGTDPLQKNLVTATYTYATTETITGYANGNAVTAPSGGRSFWTNGSVKKWTLQMPSISSSQNGSGTATEYVTYYDDEGRIRWKVDGEGYITYYSYHPNFGSLAYIVNDADPSSLPSNANNQSTKWDADTVGSASSNKPTRDTGLPAALSLVTTIEYDALGRQRKSTDASGEEHYTVYEANRTIQFPFWDGTDGSKSTATAWVYDNGDKLLEKYEVSVGYTASTSSGEPIGFSSEPSSSNYVSWNQYLRDSVTGELVESQRYYDIDGSDYYSTKYEYDDLGRRTKIRQESQGDGSPGTLVEDILEIVYDTLGRPITQKRGTKRGSTEALATVGEIEYDNDGVGDGYVTQTKRYFDSGSTNYTATRYYRTFRGHVRGIVPEYNSGSADVSTPPYTVLDLNWKGEVVASAFYTTEPSWTTTGSGVFEGDEGYDAFATSYDTGRRRVSEISRDKLGRPYQVRDYTVNASTGADGNYHEALSWYDRNDRRVARRQTNGISAEYAYDGVGRKYEARTVLALEGVSGSYYTSGKFNYCDPVPSPLYTSNATANLSSGDDGVKALIHLVLDERGNVLESHYFDANHGDTNGVDLTNHDDYVRRSVYHWYDDLNRRTATVDYGSGNDSSSDPWAYAAPQARASTAPTSTTATRLLTTYDYWDTESSARNDASLQLVTDPAGQKTKLFYDDLDRRTHLAENWDNFVPPTTNSGDGSDPSKDRATAWQYNGLDRVTKLAAIDQDGNGSGADHQVTQYLYEDTYSASRVTNVIYPDSSDNTSSGTDQVKYTYYYDGTPNTRTDQRGVVMSFSYDNLRRQTAQTVTSFGSTGDV